MSGTEQVEPFCWLWLGMVSVTPTPRPAGQGLCPALSGGLSPKAMPCLHVAWEVEALQKRFAVSSKGVFTRQKLGAL